MKIYLIINKLILSMEFQKPDDSTKLSSDIWNPTIVLLKSNTENKIYITMEFEKPDDRIKLSSVF